MDPVFPPELEQKIFEMAYDPMDRENNWNMMLVARRTRIWITSLLYRIFIQCTQTETPHLIWPNLLDTQSLTHIDLDWVCSFVKHLAIDTNRHTIERASIIIAKCFNVENLACWGALRLFDLWPVISKHRRLRRVSGVFDGFTQEHLRSPTFVHVTHLEILYPCSDWDFAALSLLGGLSHLAIYRDRATNPDNIYHQRLVRVLADCQQLHVYVECIQAEVVDVPDEALRLYAAEKRMVVFDFSMLEPNDWIRGAGGSIDAWWHAENMVFARKQGYYLSDDYRENIVSDVVSWPAKLTEEGKVWHSSLYSKL